MASSNRQWRSSTMRKIRKAITATGHQPFTTRELMRRMPGESRGSLDMALSRLAQTGEIRRLARGIYDRPKTHAVLGELPADPAHVAEAIARTDGASLIPSGRLAANVLGISTQVPAKLIFRTTGGTRRVKVGGSTVELRHSKLGRLRARDRMAATVFEALRALGPNGITPQVIHALRQRLSDKERDQIAKATPDAPAWMHPTLHELVSE